MPTLKEWFGGFICAVVSLAAVYGMVWMTFLCYPM